MSKGYLCLFLHAHLPFVRHPEEDNFLEENWLYEAITETYIPLLDMFSSLQDEQIPFRLTMSLTPPLVCMLRDELLRQRYIRHIDRLIELAEKEVVRTTLLPDYHDLALMYRKRFVDTKNSFVNRYAGDLVSAFRQFQESGVLEIVASCATHGFLPNLRVTPESVRAQIHIGIDHYIRTFRCQPRGFWLPECGYYPGLDEELAEAGIRYFFLDSHGILNGDPKPRYSVYAPVFCPTGVAAFGRDGESSKQVWSSKDGYPGDSDYREYYRDIGFELELDYIGPYIHDNTIRVNTGVKYWRITGNTEQKEPYRVDAAMRKAAEHAGNFMFNREKQIEHLAAHMDRKPIVVAPYDAELFGHWWYEGPQFIEFLIRKLHTDQKTVAMITPSEYLAEYPANTMSLPSASSWGHKGYSEYWLAESNEWLYRHLHVAATRMVELAGRLKLLTNDKSLERRAINQAGRELVLAESSDWPFIMRTGTMVPYANKRIRQHIGRFTRLYEEIKAGTINKLFLEMVEYFDNAFYDLECGKYYIEAPQKKNRKVTQKKRSDRKTVHKKRARDIRPK